MRTESQQFYTNTLVQIAPDSTATTGIIPPMRSEVRTVALCEYELLSAQPYKLTQHELIFETYIIRQGLSTSEAKRQRATIWDELFRKSYPCMRASMLTKKYGWGAHYDAAGRLALHAVDSPEYANLARPNSGTALVLAMRGKRA